MRAVIVLEKFLRTCTGEIWCLFFLDMVILMVELVLLTGCL